MSFERSDRQSSENVSVGVGNVLGAEQPSFENRPRGCVILCHLRSNLHSPACCLHPSRRRGEPLGRSCLRRPERVRAGTQKEEQKREGRGPVTTGWGWGGIGSERTGLATTRTTSTARCLRSIRERRAQARVVYTVLHRSAGFQCAARRRTKSGKHMGGGYERAGAEACDSLHTVAVQNATDVNCLRWYSRVTGLRFSSSAHRHSSNHTVCSREKEQRQSLQRSSKNSVRAKKTRYVTMPDHKPGPDGYAWRSRGNNHHSSPQEKLSFPHREAVPQRNEA